MRTLIYKRTHNGDPDPLTGEFGCNDCMGSVRGWQFDAVIGIGGIGAQSRRHGLAGRLTWIGIGARKIDDPDRPWAPRVRFRHFWYKGERGPLLTMCYPALAQRMYDGYVRVLMHSPVHSADTKASKLDGEVKKILRLALMTPTSSRSAAGNLPIRLRKCVSRSSRTCVDMRCDRCGDGSTF